jgi:tRNA(Met) C34 N-acetyltransferase TmcA
MTHTNYRETALFEHRFWLQVLGDHSRFIYDSLSPKETAYIRQAQSMIQEFDALLQQARRNLEADEIASLTTAAQQKTMQLRQFKLTLLRKHLDDELAIGLSPTFLNHMVNELEEYVRILSYLLQGQIPPVVHPVHHHLLWLLDAAGHAGAIEDELDHAEKMMKAKSRTFTRQFEDFYLKAVEMAGFFTHKFGPISGINAF